eukprot:CAMPEP_0119009870 /NCGR_PEP_ID=MMETSP1176-20130426/4646_1 /TAXON_ID=265551 /ORGANISM="Synedropsis recta cf, Strain CCMP1620" /LENGTH=53 /DNA_ID=CAMNT_0006962451 /DNA_START=1096 /DNA_END=1257 /DNA_ORIENTATION=-
MMRKVEPVGGAYARQVFFKKGVAFVESEMELEFELGSFFFCDGLENGRNHEGF